MIFETGGSILRNVGQVIRQALLNRRGLKNSGAVFRLLLFRYCRRHVYVLELTLVSSSEKNNVMIPDWF